MSDLNPLSTLNKLALLLQGHHFRNVLDLGAWKWNHSLLCASYHCEVDSVDPDTRDEFKYQTFLVWHPHIKHHLLTAEEFNITKNYDLILFLNVMMFMKKDFVLGEYLPQLEKHLIKWWILFLAFLVENNDLMGKVTNQVFYNQTEVGSALSNLQILESYCLTSEKNHPKHGIISLTSQVMIFKKA